MTGSVTEDVEFTSVMTRDDGSNRDLRTGLYTIDEN